MLSFKKIFILFFLVGCNSIFCQELIGVWKGELEQDTDKTFYFEIRIDKAIQGGAIEGTTYIESYGDGYGEKGDFGTIEFNGFWNGNSIVIQEIKIVQEEKKSSNYYWCIKKLTLKYKEEYNELILEGPWTSYGGCVPGTLKVKKLVPIKNPVFNIDTLENTVVETKYQLLVESNTIDLYVWDNNLVDGDIISLNLNGDWILRDYTVEKAKKKITIKLKEKESILILHAENLGTHPPNTAAIIVNDGTTEQKITLSSDKGKSEAIKITMK